MSERYRPAVLVVVMSERPVTLDARDLDLVVRALMAQASEYRKHGSDPSPRGLYAWTQSDRARGLASRLAGLPRSGAGDGWSVMSALVDPAEAYALVEHGLRMIETISEAIMTLAGELPVLDPVASGLVVDMDRIRSMSTSSLSVLACDSGDGGEPDV